jgi:phosphoenolpyruvate-protein phosphotransferase
MSVEALHGDPIAPGIAVGSLRIRSRAYCNPPPISSAVNPLDEVARFRHRVDLVEREIQEAIERLESEALRMEAEIMQTHLAMLRDPELLRQVPEAIRECGSRAEVAVERVLEGMAATLSQAEDPVLSERAADLRDLAMRLADGLSERGTAGPGAPGDETEHAVLALPDLMPSVVLEARDRGVVGFVVACGTSVSHAAILAKSFGLPVVRVARLDSLTPYAGRNVLVWGGGEVLVEPTDAELQQCSPREQDVPVERSAGAPRIGVWISIVDPDQLESLDWTGVDGVGLYRSEALFMRLREDFPSEEAQFEAYRRLFELAGPRPVVFRTADLGADKPVEHLLLGPQENPCLGLRAHRLFHFHPEILITQVRAVLRAAYGGHRLRLMYPMIESIDQLRFVQGLVARAAQSLADEGQRFQRDFLQGVLIETPSAVWGFQRLLEGIDFASIGTNDLVQYLFAVERNAANVADLYQPEHPITLQVIHSLAEQAAAAGKPLSVCGEMAADASMLPVLVGLGVTDLSVAAGVVNAVRRKLGTLDAAGCSEFAGQCLRADSLAQVRTLIGRSSLEGNGGRAMVREGEALDPVCGMVVNTRETDYVARMGGVAHYFCSKSCLTRFLSGADPHHAT